VPVVASDVGAVGPTVRSDGTGWVVPPGDATALREAIELAAADRDAYDLVRDNVRRAAERHAPAAITDQLRSIYERAATLR
jgi:glycosyltransferase involved in cell wall biosynthesis